MGWLWSSSSDGDARKSDAAPERKGFGLTEEQRMRMFGQSDPISKADPSREAQVDKELEAFLNGLSTAESKEGHADSKQTTPKPATTEPQEPPVHDRIQPDGSLNISPAALYPRTMSCREAFDQAFYCQSLGGKFNDIYRYGNLQSCGEQWGAFWFCMRTRTLPAKERERHIKDHYAARDERKRKEFGNSEDVWEIRTEPVQKAFWKDPDADESDGLQLKE